MERLAPSGRDLRDLIDRCLSGVSPACEALIKVLKQVCRPVLKGFSTLREPDREDLFHDAWERLQRAFQAGKPNDSSNAAIAGYVRITARNQALNFLRARRTNALSRAPFAPAGGDDVSSGDPLDTVHAAGLSPEQRAVLERAIEALQARPAVDQLIFIRKFHGATTAEIVRELKESPYRKTITTVAIDIRYHKLCRRLRDE